MLNIIIHVTLLKNRQIQINFTIRRDIRVVNEAYYLQILKIIKSIRYINTNFVCYGRISKLEGF